MPITKSGIAALMRKSLKTAEPFFVLSALPTSELDAIAEQRTAIWQHSGRQNKTGNNLAVLTLSFPWSENPAHSLFAQIIEQWKPEDLKALVQRKLGYGGDDTHKVTTNAQFSKALFIPAIAGMVTCWSGAA